MVEPLRILVTNDDGASSPGLWHLAAALRGPDRQVVVAAPLRDSSGFAAAVGDVAPGAVIDARATGWPAPWSAVDDPAWVVDGPPGRCVLAGVLGVFGARPDVVVSGINAGANTGRFLQLHSGTLGAALTAGNSGLRAMAVSLDTSPRPAEPGEERHWDVAARVAALLLAQLQAQPRRTVWNVNVPNVAWGDVRGIGEAQLGRSRQVMATRDAGDGRHEIHLVPSAGGGEAAAPGSTDRALLDDARVAITSVTPPGLSSVGDVVLDLGGRPT